MRLLVATDEIGLLSSAAAGAVLASAWPTATSTVVPVGEAGGGFAQATADRLGVDLVSGMLTGVAVQTAHTTVESVVAVRQARSREPGIPYAASSRSLGRALSEVLLAARQRRRPLRRVWLDLAGLDVHDAGAGLLAGLGARADRPLDAGVAGLGGLTDLDLSEPRAALEGVELIGVLPTAEQDRILLGLRGITSLRGRATGATPELLLATDAALENFARLAAPERAAEPGAGGCGGLGLSILALGGRLTTGPRAALSQIGTRPDLVVTGCGTFDFATRGGGVVAEAARVAATALCPCIVVAGEVLVGGREMRTMGVEAAYAVRESSVAGDDAGRPSGVDDVTAELLGATARRVARSWTW